MSTNRLIYLPLGGAGEIGMNCYVYGYGPADKERLIVVDLGVTFPDMDSSPGVDLIMADIAWLEARKDRIDGIFITHGHEDHIGALGHLWPKLKRPVYARRFTGLLGKLKMDEYGLPADALTIVAARPHVVEAGPFKVQFVPISHSIPECSMLIIDTPAGRIVHTGDFKLDATPVVGEGWDEAAMREIAAEAPVKVLACDSTNVFSTHAGRSEATLRDPIRDLVKGRKGMVVATTFASNIARLKTLADAGIAADRSVCLLGRANGSVRRNSTGLQPRDIEPPNVVATTIPLRPLTRSRIGSRKVASDRPAWVENTFAVAGQHLHRCFHRDLARRRLVPSLRQPPVSHILKCPVVDPPAGVWIGCAHRTFRIEWLIGTNCTLNGPASTWARGHVQRIRRQSIFVHLRLAHRPVNLRA